MIPIIPGETYLCKTEEDTDYFLFVTRYKNPGTDLVTKILHKSIREIYSDKRSKIEAKTKFEKEILKLPLTVQTSFYKGQRQTNRILRNLGVSLFKDSFTFIFGIYGPIEILSLKNVNDNPEIVEERLRFELENNNPEIAYFDLIYSNYYFPTIEEINAEILSGEFEQSGTEYIGETAQLIDAISYLYKILGNSKDPRKINNRIIEYGKETISEAILKPLTEDLHIKMPKKDLELLIKDKTSREFH